MAGPGVEGIVHAASPFTAPLIWEQLPSAVQRFARLCSSMACAVALPAPRAAADRAGQNRGASGIRSPPVSACPPTPPSRARLERRAQGQGHRGRRSSMPAYPATPPRAGSVGSTGRCRTDTDAVILELGANDALRGVDPEITKAALDAILGKLDARHVPVLLAGMARAAQHGRRLCARVRRHLSGACLDSSRRLLSVLPRGRRRRSPSSTRAMDCIPRRPASM